MEPLEVDEHNQYLQKQETKNLEYKKSGYAHIPFSQNIFLWNKGADTFD